jgi:predicted lipid-binding transport protein (Tim44 family)
MDGGFQFIDIILFAMIAAFLVLRLRSVLGRRDGTDGSHVDPFRHQQQTGKGDNIVHLPDRGGQETEQPSGKTSEEATGGEAETPLAAALTQIKVADPSFDTDGFIAGARAAFEMILDAFTQGNRKALKPMLSGDVFANFDAAIREREEAGESAENNLVGIKKAEITEAAMEGRTAQITVKFVTEQVNVVHDAEGRVVDGDPNEVNVVTDIWTFSRDTTSRDPNWTLVATSVPE